MKSEEFKRTLAALIHENRNQDAMAFVERHLPTIRQSLSAQDRLLVADWMEGVEMALDLAARPAAAPTS